MGKISDYLGLEDFKKGGALWKALCAEFLGTMFLVFVGCGSCLTGWTDDYNPSTVQISLAFGLVIASMAQAIGHVSGCHINPAITFGLLAARRIAVIRAILYAIIQCLGAVTGAAILMSVTPTERQGNLGMTTVNEHISSAQALGIEIMVTFVLVITVLGATDGNNDVRGSAPLAIGLSITAGCLYAVPITGGSLNPARSFGPAVVSGIWDDHWVYWVGPLGGGLFAGILYTYVYCSAPPPPLFPSRTSNRNETESAGL